jgi:DNA replicative helicase MCM subunit Mcm2 (Cdc46/Mcm family)
MAEFLAASGPKEHGSPAQYEAYFCDFLIEKQLSQIELLLLTPSESKEHRSVNINMSDLIDFEPTLAFYTINYPKLLLPLFEKAVWAAQQKIVRHPRFLAKYLDLAKKAEVKPENLVHVRLFSLPPTPEISKLTINHVNSDNISSLIQISGTVVRTGSVRMLEESKQYQVFILIPIPLALSLSFARSRL